MANITEQTMMCGLEDRLHDAIEEAGGQIPEDTCIWKYPNIIKEQLTAGTIKDINLLAGDGISIEKDEDGNYKISANSKAVMTETLNPPDFVEMDPYKDGTTIQQVLEDIFYKIFPKVPSIIRGDIITADEHGEDRYDGNPEDVKNGLHAGEQYMRIYLVSQKEPIYISLQPIGGSKESYVFHDSDSIKFTTIDNVITATVDVNHVTTEVSKHIINDTETINNITKEVSKNIPVIQESSIDKLTI